MIKISKNTSIYKLTSDYSQIKDIMIELGFYDIVKTGMIQSVGRFMTIEKGATIKKIQWEIVTKKFKEHGFELY